MNVSSTFSRPSSAVDAEIVRDVVETYLPPLADALKQHVTTEDQNL